MDQEGKCQTALLIALFNSLCSVGSCWFEWCTWMPCRIMMMYGITILCRITIYSMMYQDGTHSRSILLIASGGTQLHARFTSTHSNSTHSSHQLTGDSSTPPGTGNTSSDSTHFNLRPLYRAFTPISISF